MGDGSATGLPQNEIDWITVLTFIGAIRTIAAEIRAVFWTTTRRLPE